MENVCRQALDEVQLAYPEAVFDFEAAGNLDTQFDPARFQQVLSNLLINAAKYSPKKTTVMLSASEEAEIIVVQVKNFGQVIPPESLRVIFNPLVQLSAQDPESHPSTSLGLGLFIAREIVEGHNGTIEALSSEKDGTIFTIRVPRN